MSIAEFHSSFANTALYFFIILSLWGYFRFFRKQGLSPAYWGALVIAEIIMFVQSGIGAYMWIIGLRPGREVHILYGVVSLMAIPMVYMYTKGRPERAEMLMYGTTALITVGLIIRAMTTGFG